ncbi:MAG: hypothetical protein RIC38_05295 [Chromatocurvus sp.]
MRLQRPICPWLLFSLIAAILPLSPVQAKTPFSPMDVFALEWAEDPQISPDGHHVLYRRMGMDITTDSRRGNLWLVADDGDEHRKLTSFEGDESSARCTLLPGGRARWSARFCTYWNGFAATMLRKTAEPPSQPVVPRVATHCHRKHNDLSYQNPAPRGTRA